MGCLLHPPLRRRLLAHGSGGGGCHRHLTLQSYLRFNFHAITFGCSSRFSQADALPPLLCLDGYFPGVVADLVVPSRWMLCRWVSWCCDEDYVALVILRFLFACSVVVVV